MTSTFTIDTADGRALMLTAVNGENSVLIFPTRANAQAFVDNHPVVGIYVVELTASTIREWVDEARRDGANHAFLDPPAVGTMKNAGRATLHAMLAVALKNKSTAIDEPYKTVNALPRRGVSFSPHVSFANVP